MGVCGCVRTSGLGRMWPGAGDRGRGPLQASSDPGLADLKPHAEGAVLRHPARGGSPPSCWHLVLFIQVWVRRGTKQGGLYTVFPSELPDASTRVLS